MLFMLTVPSASAWWIFGADLEVQNVYREDELIDYLPLITNNILPDKIYGTIAESSKGVAYCYMFWWAKQDGFYSLAEHDHDWEFIVVYTNTEGKVYQVNYDSYHYYIGREYNPTVYDGNHTLMYCYEEYHNFKPDVIFRVGQIERQLNNTDVYEWDEKIAQRAQQEVSFDPELFEDPWSWRDSNWMGRYTAFDSAWKAFWVVTDKEVDWINFEDVNNFFSKIADWF